jgi:uncharacterized membrane protein YphA (DoxX/SURF4 family)
MLRAHETWFTDRRPEFAWSFVTETETLIAIGIAVAVAVLWKLIARRAPAPELPFLRPLGRLAPWVPRLLGVHAGVSLLAQAASGTYLAPSLDLPEGDAGIALAILEAVIGIWLIAGYKVRPAAWLLVAAGPIGAFGYGVLPILERIDLLGVALFLAILPPDDNRPGGRAEPDPRHLTSALLSLRILVGGALVVLAFTEKLARPRLALAFLDRYPAFNIVDTLGIEMSDQTFVRVAGGIELLFGLLLILGAMPQIAVIVAGIPFNATLFFLGASELIGHLPVYGAMLALLVYGSSRTTAPLVPAWPWTAARATVTVRTGRRLRYG